MTRASGGIRQLADRLVPDVLDEAVADAREQARQRLAAALAEEIVAAALAEEAPTPARTRPPDRPAPPARPTATTQPPATGPATEATRGVPPARTGLYAYGITDVTTDAHDLVGLDDRAPVETVTVGDAALVTSAIDLGLLTGLEDEVSATGQLSESGRLAELAGRHDRVLSRLLERGPVLPLRFGTVLPDRSRAERLLRASAGELAGELDRVRDHREWGLRVTPPRDEAAPAREGETVGEADAPATGVGDGGERPGAGGEPPETGSGTAYLSARREDLRRAALREERLTELTGRIHEELAALASETAIRSGRPGAGRLGAAYLVASAKEEDFLDAADAAVRELTAAGCEARLTGPWPPYSFVRLTLGEVRDA